MNENKIISLSSPALLQQTGAIFFLASEYIVTVPPPPDILDIISQIILLKSLCGLNLPQRLLANHIVPVVV